MISFGYHSFIVFCHNIMPHTTSLHSLPNNDQFKRILFPQIKSNCKIWKPKEEMGGKTEIKTVLWVCLIIDSLTSYYSQIMSKVGKEWYYFLLHLIQLVVWSPWTSMMYTDTHNKNNRNILKEHFIEISGKFHLMFLHWEKMRVKTECLQFSVQKWKDLTLFLDTEKCMVLVPLSHNQSL